MQASSHGGFDKAIFNITLYKYQYEYEDVPVYDRKKEVTKVWSFIPPRSMPDVLNIGTTGAYTRTPTGNKKQYKQSTATFTIYLKTEDGKSRTYQNDSERKVTYGQDNKLDLVVRPSISWEPSSENEKGDIRLHKPLVELRIDVGGEQTDLGTIAIDLPGIFGYERGMVLKDDGAVINLGFVGDGSSGVMTFEAIQQNYYEFSLSTWGKHEQIILDGILPIFSKAERDYILIITPIID